MRKRRASVTLAGGRLSPLIIPVILWEGGVFLCPEGQRRVIILGVVLIVLGYLLLIPVLITIGWILAGIGLVLLLIAVIGHREIGGRRYWF